MARAAVAEDKSTQKKKTNNKIIMLIIRQIAIFVISLAIVIATVLLAVNIFYRELLRSVDPVDATEIVVNIPRGASLNRIADILYQKDLIRNEFVFELFVDLTDRAHMLKAGEYTLSRNMGVLQILDRLMMGGVVPHVVRFRISEGHTIREMAEHLAGLKKEDGSKMFEFTAQEFVDAAGNIDALIPEFPFLENISSERRQGQYPLEGYLFPDTYDAYSDAPPGDIVELMLRTFGRKVYNEEFNFTNIADRANEIGMTIDEVVVLASIIQAEAGRGEFHKVSAVFHNRIDEGMRLESCSTVLYIVPREEWAGPFATAEQQQIDSPYNTYMYHGLPIGPISAPSQLAVEAALYPYEEYMRSGNRMLFFVYTGEGTHVFSTNYEDHKRAIETYEYRWR